jgi:hypothetical protein
MSGTSSVTYPRNLRSLAKYTGRVEMSEKGYGLPDTESRELFLDRPESFPNNEHCSRELQNDTFSKSLSSHSRGDDDTEDSASRECFIDYSEYDLRGRFRQLDSNIPEQEVVRKASTKQVGGTHYKDCAIQPLEYAIKNNLGPAEQLCIKYITRQKGPEDIRKAIHSLELLLEWKYGHDS